MDLIPKSNIRDQLDPDMLYLFWAPILDVVETGAISQRANADSQWIDYLRNISVEALHGFTIVYIFERHILPTDKSLSNEIFREVFEIADASANSPLHWPGMNPDAFKSIRRANFSQDPPALDPSDLVVEAPSTHKRRPPDAQQRFESLVQRANELVAEINSEVLPYSAETRVSRTKTRIAQDLLDEVQEAVLRLGRFYDKTPLTVDLLENDCRALKGAVRAFEMRTSGQIMGMDDADEFELHVQKFTVLKSQVDREAKVYREMNVDYDTSVEGEDDYQPISEA
ncbi:hypothetical protein ABW19_dt0209575 [Dactylella cylindrospora]|nr:hypothetical protein ABW19_dt0209575 [Dactylella cylindrospora]